MLFGRKGRWYLLQGRVVVQGRSLARSFEHLSSRRRDSGEQWRWLGWRQCGGSFLLGASSNNASAVEIWFTAGMRR